MQILHYKIDSMQERLGYLLGIGMDQAQVAACIHRFPQASPSLSPLCSLFVGGVPRPVAAPCPCPAAALSQAAAETRALPPLPLPSAAEPECGGQPGSQVELPDRLHPHALRPAGHAVLLPSLLLPLAHQPVRLGVRESTQQYLLVEVLEWMAASVSCLYCL